VDIFYSGMGAKKRAIINCLGVIIFLIPPCYLVLETSIPWVFNAYQIGEVSIDPSGIPARFAIKAAMPIGYFLMLIQGVSLFIKSVFVLLNKPLVQSSL
jgi:TRAP-type mannitol/chloroaromatic compound transport system permease small subunit